MLDKTVWESIVDLKRYELSVEDEPPLTKRDTYLLKALEAFLKIKGNAGITLLTLPQGLRHLNTKGIKAFNSDEFDVYCFVNYSNELNETPNKKRC